MIYLYNCLDALYFKLDMTFINRAYDPKLIVLILKLSQKTAKRLYMMI